jgi:hypothetical protein
MQAAGAAAPAAAGEAAAVPRAPSPSLSGEVPPQLDKSIDSRSRDSLRSRERGER